MPRLPDVFNQYPVTILTQKEQVIAVGPAAEAASLPEAVTARYTRVFGGGSYPQLLNISHYATTMQQVTAIWLRRCA